MPRHPQSEISHEARSIASAKKHGALVRAPRQIWELEADERVNAAEIEMLAGRRASLYRQQGRATSDVQRNDLGLGLASCTKALDAAFAAKRRLAVARELHRRGVFV